MLLLRAGAPAGCEELLGPGPGADPTAGNGAASGSPAAHGLLLRQSVVLDALAFTKKATTISPTEAEPTKDHSCLAAGCTILQCSKCNRPSYAPRPACT